MAEGGEDRYADWWRLYHRRQTALREGQCTCCAAVTRAGEAEPRSVSAVARWVGPTGDTSLLCASCLGYWQANAADDPTLAPREVVMLGSEAEHG